MALYKAYYHTGAGTWCNDSVSLMVPSGDQEMVARRCSYDKYMCVHVNLFLNSLSDFCTLCVFGSDCNFFLTPKDGSDSEPTNHLTAGKVHFLYLSSQTKGFRQFRERTYGLLLESQLNF